MKKNKMMRAASALLVAVLLTTCTISGTFAKYVTSDDAQDSARVAKWGVEVTATSDTMFKKEYKNTSSTVTVKTDATAYGDNNLVAPGTNGSITDVVLKGKPEVAVSVDYVATVTLTGWTINTNEDYCPIIFTLEDETYGVVGTGADYESDDSADLAADLKAAIDALSTTYEVNTDLATKATEAPSLSWDWAYEATNGNTYQTDAKDTKLGNLANLPTISVTIITTVTQID